MSKVVQTVVFLAVSLTLAVYGASWASEYRATTPSISGCPFSGANVEVGETQKGCPYLGESSAKSASEDGVKTCPVTGRSGKMCPLSSDEARSGAGCPFSGGSAIPVSVVPRDEV